MFIKMRRAIVILITMALLLVNPVLGITTAFFYITRRYIIAYAVLWRRLLKCEIFTPLITSASLIASLLSPHTGIAKAIVISLGGIALYLAPTMPRLSRVISLFTLGLSIETPFKLFTLLLFIPIAFLVYKATSCGYICQKVATAPEGDLGYIPQLGLVCVFEKDGNDMHTPLFRYNNWHVKCTYAICRAVDKESFYSEVGTLDRYLPEPVAEDFKGLIHIVAPSQTALRIVGKYFKTAVVIGNIEVSQRRLVSISKLKPDVVATVFRTVMGLSVEQSVLVRELLSRGSREELLTWSLRYPWLRPLYDLWDGGEEPIGIVKSIFPDQIGTFESLLYAYTKRIPVLTDRADIANIAAELGILTFFITDSPRDNFIILGPVVVKRADRELKIEGGRYIVHLNGALYADEL